MNNYPKHVGDYIRDTVGLSMIEDGAYGRLLDQYYAREMPLPAAKADVYRLARCTTRQERSAVDYVLAQFFRLEADGWHQRRADRELRRFAERSDKARASAYAMHEQRTAKAADEGKRTHSDRTTPDDANAAQEVVRTQHPSSASQKPEANALPADKPAGRAEGAQPALRTPPASRGTRLAETWELPEEWRQWAQQERPDWPPNYVDRVGLSFRDFWHAKAGEKARKVDWFATWRTWVRNERNAPLRPPMSLAERRAFNIDVLTGKADRDERVINGAAERLDSTAVRTLPSGLREQGRDDVGERESGSGGGDLGGRPLRAHG